MDGSWQPDPTGRHQYRWWDGSVWTDHVADNGERLLDPVSNVPRPVAVAEEEPPSVAPVLDAEVVEGPEPPREVVTFDPAGARLAALPAPKHRRPIGKYLTWLLMGATIAAAVTFLVIGQYRAHKKPPASPVSVGTIAKPGGYVLTKVTLANGQAARVRVEVPAGMQVDVWVVASADDARREAQAWATDYPDTVSDQFTDPDAAMISDAFFTAADSVVFTDAGAATRDRTFADAVAVHHVCCQVGNVLSGRFVSLTRTTYRLVVIARTGSGKVRLVVQASTGGRLQPGESFSDAFTDSDFFSDSTFFTDTAPYQPAS